jgi:putative CocE/NonD family hydrolase
MRIVRELPEPVRVVRHVWIPMRDGVRLSARLWLPASSDETPAPAILEYIPYRKDDHTLPGDEPRHRYWAGHGYASVRVDLRGSGDSEGVLMGEYLPQEQDDAEDVLAWLAEQPWCTGRVGMIGISWGGFNGLQVAARRPPQLGCVISLCSTDDRYADDVHYMGGALLGIDMLAWASTMLAYNARPPDPEIVGENRWRELWMQRLHETPPWIEEWVTHQRRDAFWKQGSVCDDYDALQVPVYMVGGWNDAYTNAIPRFLEGYGGSCKGLIGPWSHNYPEVGAPGPAIGFLQETLRWFDHWLRDRETGILDEPQLRVWMQEWAAPSPRHAHRDGRWVTESAWPSPNIEVRALAIGSGGLGRTDTAAAALRCDAHYAYGADAGNWCPYGSVADEPPDQREEDGRALCLDSDPLSERLELLGRPAAVLELTADKPLALVAVRLCDVAPDGSSLLLSRGFLNLTHRASHEHPEPVPVGERMTVRVELGALGQAIPAGHRLRLSVAPGYWPWIWPSPEPVQLTLHTGGESRLDLPVRPQAAGEPEPGPFGEPETGAPLAVVAVPGIYRAGIESSRDVAAGRTETRVYRDNSAKRIVESGMEVEHLMHDTYSIVDGDPLSASAVCRSTTRVGRGDWRTRVEATSTMTASTEAFVVTSLVEAYEGETRVFARSTERSIPRDLV